MRLLDRKRSNQIVEILLRKRVEAVNLKPGPPPLVHKRKKHLSLNIFDTPPTLTVVSVNELNLVYWEVAENEKSEFGGGIVNFEKYINLVTWFFENDNREENYQNRVLIPFETLCTGFDVVDTSMLTKELMKSIERHKFAGLYTPDLLIVPNSKLHKQKK